jgi:hypothetical protein
VVKLNYKLSYASLYTSRSILIFTSAIGTTPKHIYFIYDIISRLTEVPASVLVSSCTELEKLTGKAKIKKYW